MAMPTTRPAPQPPTESPSQTESATLIEPDADAALRTALRQRIDEAPLAQLRTLAAYFEVADAPRQLAETEPVPPVPAALVRPSDEALARELDERAARDETIAFEEAWATVTSTPQ